MYFRLDFTVNSHACYPDGTARPTAAIAYMQEAVNTQIRTYGPSYDEMLKSGTAFVLSRMCVRFHEPLHAYQTYTAETWACPSQGFSFLRCYRILDGERVLAEAVSVWALIQIESKRPLRVTEYHPNFTLAPMLDYEMPPRMRLSPDALTEVGEFTVHYSDTDSNRHMNNTVYADRLCDFLDMAGRRVAELNITYQNEAPLGEKITVLREEGEGDIARFRTLRSDGRVNVEAEIHLADL